MNEYILPIITIFIICYGYIKKVNVYESFIKGTIDGFKVVIEITPTIITIMFAVTIFVKSNIFHKLFTNINIIKPEVLAMMFLRPISGNASLAMLKEIYTIYGVDSFSSFLASLIQGSTETTIYVVSLYFSYVKVTKIRNTLKIGLLVDLFGIILALIFSFIFYL